MKRALWHITCVLTLLVSFLPASAQTQRDVNVNTHFWTSLNTTFRVTDKWGGVADVHIRRTNFISDPSFYFARVGGAYFLDSRFSFVAGYAHLWLAQETDIGLKFANDNRAYQQAQWRAQIERVTFLQRVRIEQRWNEILSSESGEVDRIAFTNRVRFLFSMALKVFENDKLPRLVVSDEVHIQFGKEIIYNTFNQNRIFIGVSQRISPTVSFDFGYMHVYQQKATGFQYDSNHTIRLFFYYTPDFRKKKNSEFPHFPLPGEE